MFVSKQRLCWLIAHSWEKLHVLKINTYWNEYLQVQNFLYFLNFLEVQKYMFLY